MYNKFYTIKSKLNTKFNLLNSLLPFKLKAKIVLPTIAIAAIAIPVSIFAISNLSRTNTSNAITEQTTERQLDEHEQELKQQREQEEQAKLEQHNQELLAMGLDPNYKSPNAMPAPFVDQNFYNCVELRFKAEYPTETIPSTGLTDEQLAKIKTLTCRGDDKPGLEKITDASGLEKLTALTNFDVRRNKLATLDATKNTALTYLDARFNQLASLDVSHNTALAELYAGVNQLTSLDVSNNTTLTTLQAYENQLTSLDVSNNTTLAHLDVSYNNLPILDVSGATALTELEVYNNKLTTLDVTKNTALTGLDVSSNQLTTLDVTKNTALTKLYVYDNQLTTLDVSHNTSLTDLNVGSNQLTTLDVTHNTALKELNVWYNQLTTLDVTKNTALTRLRAYQNQLTTLDVTKNPALTKLDVSGNNLTALDLRQNPELDVLRADDIMLRTSITGTQVGSNRNFDLTEIKFIGDCDDFRYFNYKNTIPNTSNYTFNETTRLLSVNNLAGAGGYAQITATSGDYATYKLQLPKVYKLHYDLNGTSGTVSDTECESMDGYCDAVVGDTEPTRIGYKFLGWADSSSATSAQYHKGDKVRITDPASEKTIYAIWAPAHHLNYDANGGSGAPSSQVCYPTTTTGSCDITIPSTEPSKTGYTFKGWADSSSATSAKYQPGGNITLSGSELNKTIYAVWQANKYNVTFNQNYEGAPSPTVLQETYDSNYTLPSNPTRSHYIFKGWYTQAEGGTQVTTSTKVTTTSDHTLYAHWQEAPKVTYTLNYDANQGTGAPSPQSQESYESATFTISSTKPTRDGYYFLGWAKSASATSAQYQPGQTITLTAPTTSTTLFAVWSTEPPEVEYMLAYNANGGTGAPTTQTCKTKTGSCSITISSTKPTRDGYTFKGWADSKTATSAKYQPNSQITLSGPDTLKTIYAVWEENQPGPVPPEPTPDPEPTPTPTPTPGTDSGTTTNTKVPNTGEQTNTDNSTATILMISILLPILMGVGFFVGRKLAMKF